MPPFPKAAIIFLATILATICLWTIVDRLLPAEEMDSRVLQLLEDEDSLTYVIYGTGGGVGTCPIPHGDSLVLQQHTEIVAIRTPIFGTCIDVKPTICKDLLCSSEHDVAIDVVSLLSKAIQYSYGDEYLTVNELFQDYPGYTPEIRKWPIVRSPIYPVRYSVRMPEQLVIFDKYGRSMTSRTCGSVEGYCEKIPRFIREAHEE